MKPKDQDDGDVIEIKVFGEGATPVAAFEDAVLSALRQVAGAFMRSDRKVEGDRIVEERVIAHSQGFVEKATKVGEARLEDGVYRQNVVVLVRRGRIAELLSEPARADGRFDGTTLAARLGAMQAQKASAQQLVEAAFKGWPANVIAMSVSMAPDLAESRRPAAWAHDGPGPDDAYLEALFDASVDRAKWAEWCAGASKAFEAIAIHRVSLDWSVTNSEAVLLPSIDREVREKSYEFSKRVGAELSDRAAEKRHLYGEEALDKLAEAARKALELPEAAAPQGSVKRPENDLAARVIVVLSVSDEAPAELYLVERAALALVIERLGAVPRISFEMTDPDTGVAIGRPYPRTDTATRSRESVARDLHVAASPVFPKARPVGLYNTTQRMDLLLLAPWLRVRAGLSDHLYFSEAISLRCGFIVPKGDLPRAGAVRATLGDRVESGVFGEGLEKGW